MYTKGEWEIKPLPEDNSYRILVNNQGTTIPISICDVFGMNADDRENANLIASAPRLYNALDNILDKWTNHEELTLADIRQAQEAMNQAQGK
jgi:hypothetical protein